MHQKVQRFISKHHLLSHNKPIIVGVSGGVDSVVLLHILHSLGYECIVAHCNFNLRGKESDEDEIFVINLAKEMGLEIQHIGFQTNEYAKSHKISLEMAARDLRYEWFKKMREKYNAQSIAVAHHTDDNIETLLLNLIRGTGLKGLTGMQPKNRQIVRPLLCCSRIEIEDYCKQNKLYFRTDSSNATNDVLRNKIRNQLLPLLESYNPSIRKSISSTIEHLLGSYHIFEQKVNEIISQIIHNQSNEISINIPSLLKQPECKTILFEILNNYGFNSDQIEKIEKCLLSQPGKIFYSPTHILSKDRESLIISNLPKSENKIISIPDENAILHITDFELKIFERNDTFLVSKNPTIIHLDADQIIFPITIRKWKDGDYFFPFGMSKKKKISNYLIDQKLALIKKNKVFVLISGKEIACIIGLRADNRFAITESTKRILEIRV